MTTSIVFNDNMTCLDICYNPGVSDNNDFTISEGWLTDPTEPRDALRRLRFLKSRENGEEPIIPDIESRDRGINVNTDTYSLNDYRMRRKAEALQYNKNKKDTSNNSKKMNYSQIVKNKSYYKNMTNERIKKLKNSQICSNTNIIKNKAYKSGIKSGTTILFKNTKVPFYESL